MNSRASVVGKLCLPDIYRGKDPIASKLSPKKKRKKVKRTSPSHHAGDDDDDALSSSSDTSSDNVDERGAFRSLDSDSNISSSSSSSSETSAEGDDDEGEQDESLRSLNRLRAPQARGWKILRRHLKKGTLLLRINNHNGGGDGSSADISCRSRKSVREAIAHEFRVGLHFSIRFCLMTILAYLVISIAMYSCVFEPTWTIIDSCYFAVTTFTTLGYGDLSPTNTASLVFTCIYALTGVAFLGLTLGVLGNQLIEKHEGMVEQVETENKEEVMELFGTMPQEDDDDWQNHSTRSWWSSYDTTSHRSSRYGSSTKSTKSAKSSSWQRPFFLRSLATTLCGGGSWNWQRFVWLCALAVMLVSYIAFKQGWSVMTTLYYVIVTSCTIGYGDLVPTTQMQRLAAVIYIPLVCLIMGHWLAYVANAIIERQSFKFRKMRLDHRELTQDDLDAMDANGNGKVSWAEFLEFMLVAMEKVDFELIDELQMYFRQLDVAQTGELSRDDLVEAARRKLKCARRKLELAKYKRHVLNLGKFPDRRRRRHDQRRPQNDPFASISNMLELTIRNLNLFDMANNNNDDGEGDGRQGDDERRPLLMRQDFPRRRGESVRYGFDEEQQRRLARQARQSFLSSRNIFYQQEEEQQQKRHRVHSSAPLSYYSTPTINRHSQQGGGGSGSSGARRVSFVSADLPLVSEHPDDHNLPRV